MIIEKLWMWLLTLEKIRSNLFHTLDPYYSLIQMDWKMKMVKYTHWEEFQT